jgi:hypothetical protein
MTASVTLAASSAVDESGERDSKYITTTLFGVAPRAAATGGPQGGGDPFAHCAMSGCANIPTAPVATSQRMIIGLAMESAAAFLPSDG